MVNEYVCLCFICWDAVAGTITACGVVIPVFDCVIIIIIIEKNRQCKAGRGRLTPYQSEDPSPTLPTYRGKEEKGKIVKNKKGETNYANKKALDLLLKPANPTPSNTG